MAVPGVPTGLTLTQATAVSLAVSWTASSGSPTSYSVQYTPLNGGSQTVTGITATTYTITGLPPNTPVAWTVSATNGSGTSAYASVVTSNTQIAANQPADYGNVNSGTPTLMLRWSDDGGHNWSTVRYGTAGPLGVTAQRVMFKRLGGTRRTTGLDRIFELSSADRFKVALIGAEIDP